MLGVSHLLQLRALGLLILAGLCCLSVELLGRELRGGIDRQLLGTGSRGSRRTYLEVEESFLKTGHGCGVVLLEKMHAQTHQSKGEA